LHPEFELHLYVSFQSRADAIALDVLEGLQELVRNNKSKSLHLHLRFSDQKSRRWDDAFVREQMKNVKSVQKVWVCGPPVMEESFEQILEKACKDFDIDFRT